MVERVLLIEEGATAKIGWLSEISLLSVCKSLFLPSISTIQNLQ